mgnify:FL=1
MASVEDSPYKGLNRQVGQIYMEELQETIESLTNLQKTASIIWLTLILLILVVLLFRKQIKGFLKGPSLKDQPKMKAKEKKGF